MLGVWALAGGGLSGCTTNPATGRSYYDALPRDQEIALGVQAAPELVKEYGGKVPNASVQQYLTEVGKSLAAKTEADYPGLPWEFTLLDSDVINAFALPGGKVFMSRGLAEKMTTEAQLASVLGHEVGHVTAQHVDERYGRAMGASVGLGVVGILLGGQGATGSALEGAGQLTQIVLLGYDRRQESESDALGIRYMTRAGYNPIGSLEAMQIIAEESKGGRRPPEMLSTHPEPGRRVGEIRAILEREFPESLRDKTSNTYPDRFRTRLLTPLAMTPRDELNVIAAEEFIAGHLGDARAWCGICRAAAGREYAEKNPN
jgi:predicted Zn-dependent protease